jgi:PAS domain S-box-containing protein
MKDEDKTKDQLINELVELRRRIAELEKAEIERKRVEQALLEAREYAENIEETVREPLLVLDADLRVVSANRSFYQAFKVTPEEAEGQFIYDLGNRQWEIPRLRELLEEILPENTTFENFEVEHDFLTIGRRVMLLNARRIYREANKTQLILLAIEDVTERKEAERLKRTLAELDRSNKELEQFAYVASHDLQEPLRMVSSYVQLLARRYRGKLDADADEFIQYAVDGVTSMQNLINALLAYSRVSTRGQDFVPTDCQAVFDRAVAHLQAAIEESGAVVTHGPLPTVIADATQLEQLFQNLIGNAIKFRSDKQPEVNVRAERKDYEWLFSVQDNGIGINPDYHQRIFGIFERLHGTEYPGTGIGLAICKKIALRHGGRIWVDSRPERGQYSTSQSQ